MNDAGQGPEDSDASGPRNIAWFQVGMIRPIPIGRSLPIQPFLACVRDVMDRIGTMDLQAIQLLLPMHYRTDAVAAQGMKSVGVLARDNSWFADSNPDSETSVHITLDSGQDISIPATAPLMLQDISRFDQRTFSSFSLTTEAGTILPSPVVDQIWNGPPLNKATIQGTLAEWSLDALGWLAALLVDTASRRGVRVPVLCTINRQPNGERWSDGS